MREREWVRERERDRSEIKSSEGIWFGGLWRRKLEGRSCFANWSAGGLEYRAWTYLHSCHRLKMAQIFIQCAPLVLLLQCEYHRIILHYSMFVALPSHLLLWFHGFHAQDAAAAPAVPELPESMMGEVAEVTTSTHSHNWYLQINSLQQEIPAVYVYLTISSNSMTNTTAPSKTQISQKHWQSRCLLIPLATFWPPWNVTRCDQARLRAELYAARDEVRSLQRDFDCSWFCRLGGWGMLIC